MFMGRSLHLRPKKEITVGSREDWLSFRNNNMMVERLIGQVRNCVLDKKVQDSDDSMSNSVLCDIDERIKAYVTSAYH